MPPFAEAILYVFLLIAFGYAVALFGLLREGTAEGVADFVFKIGVPVLLFRTIATADFEGISPWPLWATYFCTITLTWMLSHQMVRRAFDRDVRGGVVAGVGGSFSNLALLGLPFIDGVYGHRGLAMLSLILSIHLPLMMVATIVLFRWAARADGMALRTERPRDVAIDFLRQLSRNPLVIGILAGGAYRLTGLPLDGLAGRLVGALAGVAGPLALFSLGMGLRDFGLRGHLFAGSALAGIKLVAMPAIALVLAWAFALPPLSAKVAVASASLPAGVNAWLIARQFNTGFRLASTSVTLGTAAGVVTTGFWLFVAQAAFG
ncbi:AEC family transporter [Pararhizobium mangrovi]|uniref:AEC family transporter n=2 Tax=Pararhizobium mangrovi TaxID=2590452 RepID=A0A506U6G8_9HYPH|nr:AEC family transporter [Pararhizobium mangrovi]